MQGWYGVDLDGTLAKYDKFEGPDVIGEPVPLMVERVKQWLKEGKKVKIFTARVSDPTQAIVAMGAIIKWSIKHIGQELEVTCYKDYGMIQLWGDRCVQVESNTGLMAVNTAFNTGYEQGRDDVENSRRID